MGSIAAKIREFLRGRWKCRYWRLCALHYLEAMTCNSGGGSYCGRYSEYVEPEAGKRVPAVGEKE